MAAGFAAVVLEGIEALNGGDLETALRQCSDELELRRVEGIPEQRLVRGKAAVLGFLAPDAFEAQTIEPLAVAEGERVVLIQALVRNRGAGSGIEMEIESYFVYRFGDDGLVHRIENWRERADAERSAGLELEP
jgi:hypothetical protein